MLLQQKIGLAVLIIAVFILFNFIKKKKLVASILFKNKKNKRSKLTPFLDLYTIDFTKEVKTGRIDPVIGRNDEVKRLSQVLSRRRKNNGILVGQPGVGKTAIVEGLAQRIVIGEVPPDLLNKRILALQVPSLLAGTKYRGEFEERARKIVDEITNSDRSIILFIDEVHAVVQSHGTEGAINFADILKPALARGELQMIGATTNDEYEEYIKKDLSLARRFQRIMVRPPSKIDALNILKGVRDKYKEYHKVEFTDAALKTAVELSEKLIKDRYLPDKAIDAIDEAAAMIKVSHIHKCIPSILQKAAGEKKPLLLKYWKKLQELDDKKVVSQNVKQKEALTIEVEKLEKELMKEDCIEIVDSKDIEKVIKDWIK